MGLAVRNNLTCKNVPCEVLGLVVFVQEGEAAGLSVTRSKAVQPEVVPEAVVQGLEYLVQGKDLRRHASLGFGGRLRTATGTRTLSWHVLSNLLQEKGPWGSCAIAPCVDDNVLPWQHL